MTHPTRTHVTNRTAAFVLFAAMAAACGAPDGGTRTPATNPAETEPMTPRPTDSPLEAKLPTAQPGAEPAPAGTPGATELAAFAGGCFWCVEAALERVPGVLDVRSGYLGGTRPNPTYEQVCAGTTGHAESVEVTFDPARLPYEQLVEWFFKVHDPTTKDRQGNDVGSHYRSVIFTSSDAQKEAAVRAMAKAQQSLRATIVTEIVPADRFWPAEEYHQDYFRKNPANAYCRATIPAKLKKLGLDK